MSLALCHWHCVFVLCYDNVSLALCHCVVGIVLCHWHCVIVLYYGNVSLALCCVICIV